MPAPAQTPPSPMEFPRRFVPPDADCGEWAQLEPYYQRLSAAPINSQADLEDWILQVSELEACIDEQRCVRHVEATRKTDDEARQQRYLDFVEQVQARQEPWRDRLQRRLLELAEQYPLPPKRYEVLLRSARNAVELFREENVPLLTQDTRFINEHEKITGAMTVEYDGREQTLPQLGRYQELPDRAVREETWRLAAERFRQDRERLAKLYTDMVALRQQIAQNAGCRDYRQYMWRRYERFDYSPEDCLKFHDSIEAAVLPAVQKLAAQRREKLGLERLRPWDLSVDPDGKPPLRPFETDKELIAGCGQIFARIHPELGRQFEELDRRGLLDLDSRKGKAPGGYQETFSERRVPFIFMNAVGTERDVRTLLHEGGHAFHSWACRNEPIAPYRGCYIEFAEVASMGMECLALPHTSIFFGDEAQRATRQFFEQIVRFFPFMARIDAFQHMVYTHPTAGLAAWEDHWQALTRRFDGGIDWTGLEEYDRQSWQRKLHIFQVPFYYVEYGIAQLGALQIWLLARNDYEQAVAFYRNGLALGGSRPLPELFEAAGCRFDFSEQTLRPLIEAVMQELI